MAKTHGMMFPPIDRMLFRQAFVGRRSNDWSGKLPSAYAVKMGTLALRCVQRAHGRS